jgi:subtilisin family serine protease
VRETDNLLFRGHIDEAEIPRLARLPEIVKVWMDAPITPFGTMPSYPCDCENMPKGNISDVAEYLEVRDLWAKGYKGNGIVVAVVDGGINAIGRPAAPEEDSCMRQVVDGWPAEDWGTTSANWENHGNMVAFDVLGMAPQASIYDVRVSGPKGSRKPMTSVISDAAAAFQWCIDRRRLDGTPHIITCSWGMMQSAWEPVYATDPTHFFTTKVEQALDAGIIVLFAAGNCGSDCCHKQCGNERGPGRSIWGANGHSRVITVGAATREEKLAGYSSQGPAALERKKPDFCGITQFEGYTSCDGGTSASTPVTAGVIALLKQKRPDLTQTEAKKVLQDTAKAIHFTGWNPHFGHGIIRPKKAFDSL